MSSPRLTASASATSESFAKNSRLRAKIKIGPRSWASCATRVSSLSPSSCRPPPRAPSDTFRIAPASSEKRSTKAPDPVGGLFHTHPSSRRHLLSGFLASCSQLTQSPKSSRLTFPKLNDPLMALPAAKTTPHRKRNSDAALRPLRLIPLHPLPPTHELQPFHFPFHSRCP